MSKVLKYSLIIVFTIIVVGFLVLTITIDSIVHSNIEGIGSEMTGTPVTVERVSISPFTGKGTITGFRVANPDGYAQEYAFTMDEFSIELDFWSLLTDEIVIREIIMIAPLIYVEQQVPDNNIHTILQHINRVDAFEASDSEMFIEYFLLQDGTVELYTEIAGERTERVEIETIELRDIGRDNGRQAVEEIVQQIAEEVGETALRAVLDRAEERVRDVIRDLFN